MRVRACVTTIHTGWVVVSVYASKVLTALRLNIVLMVGATMHVRVETHMCWCVSRLIGMAETSLCVSVVIGSDCREFHPTYVRSRVVRFVSVPRVCLESYLSFRPGGWACTCICHVMLCLWWVACPWLVCWVVFGMCVGSGCCAALSISGVRYDVMVVSLSWARQALARRTGHARVAWRDVELLRMLCL